MDEHNPQPAPVTPPVIPIVDENEITFFAQTNFRNENRRFGIKIDDRRRHMYVIGKTGMGKSTMLENMIIQDIQNGKGVAVVDPHGDLVEKVVNFIPKNRINDVVYFNPSDVDHPISFNILESVDPSLKNLVSNGLVGVFKKIWADSWGPRLEYILINAILALLEYPGSTLLGVTRMLVDAKYRKKVVSNITDPVVKSFWVDEYNNYTEKFRNEAIAPIQNKVGQFLSSSLIRNIVGQSKSTIDMRQLMDEGKIVLMNLSKGRIGEENAALLGAMMITKIQLAAMSRVDIPEPSRRDFYLYVDEFQNFSTESFANILSEARKYRLNLIMAHQYIEQLSDEVKAAVFGNVGTLIAFRVGATDAEELEKEFQPTFMQEDVVTLPAHHVYLRLMIDGVASEPFSATTLPPISGQTNEREKVIQVSREHYARDRESVEEKIRKWAGYAHGEAGEGGDDGDDSDEDLGPGPSKPAPRSGDASPKRSDRPDDRKPRDAGRDKPLRNDKRDSRGDRGAARPQPEQKKAAAPAQPTVSAPASTSAAAPASVSGVKKITFSEDAEGEDIVEKKEEKPSAVPRQQIVRPIAEPLSVPRPPNPVRPAPPRPVGITRPAQPVARVVPVQKAVQPAPQMQSQPQPRHELEDLRIKKLSFVQAPVQSQPEPQPQVQQQKSAPRKDVSPQQPRVERQQQRPQNTPSVEFHSLAEALPAEAIPRVASQARPVAQVAQQQQPASARIPQQPVQSTPKLVQPAQVVPQQQPAQVVPPQQLSAQTPGSVSADGTKKKRRRRRKKKSGQGESNGQTEQPVQAPQVVPVQPQAALPVQPQQQPQPTRPQTPPPAQVTHAQPLQQGQSIRFD